MNKTNKIWTIISFEFMSRVKSKGFIISTILGPVFLIAIIVIPGIVTALSMNETSKKIAVIDQTGIIIDKMLKEEPKTFTSTNKNISQLKKEVLQGNLDAFLVIPANVFETSNVTVYTPGGGGIGYLEKIENIISGVVREKRLLDKGFDKSVIDLVESNVQVNSVKVTSEGTQKDYTEFFSVFGYILGFMIYMLMFSYGGIVMRGVINEKVNRIIEVINSSASSMQIMMGKIFGIGAVGLVQVLVWIILAGVVSIASGSLLPMFMGTQNVSNVPGMEVSTPSMPFEIPPIPIGIWVSFLFFFLVGYFIYSSLFAAIGSAVDQEEDAAQLQMPVTMPLIIPLLFMPAILGNPDGTLSIVLSLIPFFTPIIMTARIAATSVPLWQIITSVVLSLATLYLCIWFASKVYRVGILMYGKKPSIKDLFKWIKLAK